MTFRVTVLIFISDSGYVYQKGDKGKEKKSVLSTILLSCSCSDTTPKFMNLCFIFAGFYCFISIRLLFLLLVTLVHPVGKVPVAEGTAIEREIVYENPLRKDEVAVSVNRIIIEYNSIQQPEFNYEIEAGGFNVWKTALCQR